MKKFLFAIIISCSSLPAFSVALPAPKIDERVELLSIVFRLAGNEEYNSTENTAYVNAIHSHFDKFSTHPLIAYVKQIRDSSGIAYDRVMSMAVALQWPSLDPIISFEKQIPDKLWKLQEANRFVALLKQFSKDAAYADFFKAQTDRYRLAESRFNPLFNQLDVSWFNRFYGQSTTESFNIIISLGNGRGNYGPHLNTPDGQRNAYAIIGAGTFDSAGDPEFKPVYYLPTLIHEFNHSFVNQLGEKFKDSLEKSCTVIYEKDSVRMNKQHYKEWLSMFNEALVRASVILYLREHATDTLAADKELKSQLALGFFWMGDLVKLLRSYENDRKTYPTLESFMPNIVSLYKKVAPEIGRYEEDYLAHYAKVLSASPADNQNDVSPQTTEITFHFDRPLDGVRYFFGPGKLGIAHYPKPSKVVFSDGNKAVTMQVTLQPNTEYQVRVNGNLMRTSDGYPVQNYLLTFKTAEK
jgi:Domain of unknown function (DUF4932)/Bacterial Ig-like domain